MGALSGEQILTLHAALVAADLGEKRPALLAGLDAMLVLGIARAPDAAGQLLVDLHALNRAALADGSVPLAALVRNALALAGERVEAEVFRGMLAVMAPRAAEVAVSIARLPATAGVLFGREADLGWLDACWKERVHVASVVAFGGVGKSALVNRWLAGMRDGGWEGVARVYGWSFYSQGTDRLSSSDEFVDAALRWFGDADPTRGAAWDKGERLAELVRRERTVLILDGVEPLQWGPGVQEGKFKDPALQALLKELGARNKGLCVVTSRIALTDLEGMHGKKARAKDLGSLSPEAGAALLQVRGAKGTPEELREASREYKGHGLALTLLGSYLADVAEGDIRRHREIGPLEEDERQGAHARRVMAAYEGWLGKPEVAILRMVGLFDRPVEEDEIAALRAEPPVLGLTDALVGVGGRAWNQAMARLRRAGLLAADEDKRLDAHPLVREHFGEQFRREHPEAWREGHRRLYEHLRRKAKELPETVEEMAPLYAAVVHGCLAGKNQEAFDEVFWQRVYRGDEKFNWRKLGAFGSEIALLSAFFEPPWERLAPGLTEVWQAWILNAAGFALRALGRLPEATGLVKLGLERDAARQDWENAAISASNLSELLQSRGELSEALAEARKSVDFADKSGLAFQRVSKRTTLAAALHAMGLREEADAQFDEAEQLQRETPAGPRLYAVQGFRYCDLLLDQGRDAEVRERVAQTLPLVQARLGLLSLALEHLSFGRAHLLPVQRGAAGDVAEAAAHLAQAVDGLRQAGHQWLLPLGLLARAALHTHTRAYADARRDLDEVLTLATRCGFRLHEADAHLGFARLALAERDPTAARHHLAAARSVIAATGYHRRNAELATLDAELAQMPPTAPPPAPPPPPPSPPTPTPPATVQPVHIGIVVALPEELRVLLSLTGERAPLSDDDLEAFLFTRGAYRCAVVLVGAMGEAQASTFTERLIARLNPGIVLSIGIAGGVNDLLAGDVHVPEQAVQYLQHSKAEPAPGGGFTVVPGAPAYRTDFALLKAVRGFEFRHPAAHAKWVADGATDLAALLPDAEKREALIRDDQVRGNVRLLADGHVATGPMVGAAKAFSTWIRSHDRNVKSLEMESAAVLLAAQNRAHPKRALALRGISDFGDEHKTELDRKGDGVLRRYAMRNAVRLLWALLDATALPQNPR